MSIQQFNGEWISQEDRVLFRFNTSTGEEFSFWLTRMMVRGLIQGSQQVTVKALEKTHEPQVAQAVQSFQQQSAAAQANFNDAYKPATQKPLGEAPLLVIGLVINPQDDGQTAIELQLITKNSVNLKLPPHVLQIMMTLLNKLQERAGWGVGFDDAPALALAPPEARQVH
ncbi:hypothetical protein [Limnohabitans sp. B9-3]|uniref:hypothetical protein n=1 Tax=Limnohabitans sp. B9-3 TaxID=1100707 RepID=UPI000C1EA070|nr:hypothetical protein [Limnohabitans sp. B9-3]PIT71630.1 hypothetical protein B9Z42_14265 [Limnohabitans sp. B9-3]